jgi:hypothetical protein
MALFGKQHYYCPNCGKKQYAYNIDLKHAGTLCCDDKCREVFAKKYHSMLIGKDAPPDGVTDPNPT